MKYQELSINFFYVLRYAGVQETVELIVMDAVREQLNRRQPPENITRNFLRLLSASCGLVEVCWSKPGMQFLYSIFMVGQETLLWC